MKLKQMVRSKTFWMGVGFIAYGVVNITQGETQTGIEKIMLGFTTIFARDAIAKVGQ